MWIIDLREIGINKVELVNEEVIIKAWTAVPFVVHHVIDMETFLGKE